jgi:hypothetical protein
VALSVVGTDRLHAERFLAQLGLTKDELISRRGGSP